MDLSRDAGESEGSSVHCETCLEGGGETKCCVMLVGSYRMCVKENEQMDYASCDRRSSDHRE